MYLIYFFEEIMRSKHAFENNLRFPFEFIISSIAFIFSIIFMIHWNFLVLDAQFSSAIALAFILFGIIRTYQGMQIFLFKKRLLVLKPFSMQTTDVPLSKKYLYIGRGFKWLPMHRHRLNLLSLAHNQRFIQKSVLYRLMQQRERENQQGIASLLCKIRFLPFKPLPDIGGKPWIHGVGSKNEKTIFLNQSNRNTHECIFGMTRVGKTRYLSIKVNQDIRNGEAILVIDPKSDFEVIQDMYCAAKAAGRLDDLIISHFGFPDISAKYNPLSSFTNVSEVASRVTSAISSIGDGKTFKDFAWQYVNVVAKCLHELDEPINYKTISFYIKRPEILLSLYVDKIFPDIEPDFLNQVQEIIDEHGSRIDRQGNPLEPLARSVAIKRYLEGYIESHIGDQSEKLMDSIIVPLYNAATLDKTYYDKITASIGPVLDKINQTSAQGVFSFDDNQQLPIIHLENIITKKQIVYIGLDSLTNQDMAEAVGQAIIADLVSLCGRIYTRGGAHQSSLCLHCDEFSNIVRDEFVNLLNKAGGAGIKVSAYTQTINDLGAAFSGNADKAKMLMGNFGTMTMLRVSNEDTASLFTKCVEQIKTRSKVPFTMSNDKSESQNGELFTTSNSDQISEEKISVVEINDLFSLPKGQAFVMTNGGEIYKIRIPLPKNDGSAPTSFEDILKEVNQCE